MTPVALAVRSHLRLRWRTVLALAVIFGLVAGVALTAAAGARRTDDRVSGRLLRWSRASDVLVLPGCVGFGGFYQALGRLPQVASMWTGVVYEMALPPGRRRPRRPRWTSWPVRTASSASPPTGSRSMAGRLVRPGEPGTRSWSTSNSLAREHLRPGSTLRLSGIPSTRQGLPAPRGDRRAAGATARTGAAHVLTCRRS